MKTISISEDKKSGFITISAESVDRYLAKELVDIYLNEILEYIRKIDMRELQSKERYYLEELDNPNQPIEVKEKIAKSLTALVEKRVLAKSSKFYLVKKITDSEVAHILNKTKPKRGLIVVVAFITSIILGIFGIFLIEFIKKEDNEK